MSTLAISLLLVVGCSTQTATNMNAVTNTNTVNTNVTVSTNEDTNTVVSNQNTNVEQGSEINTSDWQTYTNEEYGFSFKYPKDWTLKESATSVALNSPDLVGSTYANSLTIKVTENDFDSQKKQIENSDLIDGNLSLSRFNDDVEELNINDLDAKVGTHSTAIGLNEKYYFISLSNDKALYFEFLKPTEKLNILIEDMIHTLEIL